jgi:anti-sigma regulatory factor (Ser/Thr protein kinase)
VGVREGTSIVLDRDMANVAVARRFIKAQLAEAVSGPVLDDLVLATSELVTNAFEHGGDAATTVAVRLGNEDASITVSSQTGRNVVQPKEHWTTARPEQLNGRGLGTVRQLADRVDVRQDDDRLAITIVRRLPAAD